MTSRNFILRSLRYYWRNHAAAACGVAVAVAVLSGAFIVGESVRASLRRLVLGRLGETHYITAGTTFFRESLAAGIAAPLIALEGAVAHDSSGRRATGVAVFGVDERFFRFHNLNTPVPEGRNFLLTEDLASELGARNGDGLALRVDKPSSIPSESLHGRKDDPGRTLRGNMQGLAEEFLMRPQQGPVRAVFVSLERMQRDLEQPARVNVLLSKPDPRELLRARWALEDIGIKVRDLGDRGFNVESEAMVLSDSIAADILDTATRLGYRAEPILTYLANTVTSGDAEIPYSLVTAREGVHGIVLNEWAARELKAKPGDDVSFEYYEWLPTGRLVTKRATYQLTAVAPLRDERDLAPEYPGISDSDSLSDWDPPFPMDLSRIRKSDEQYWDRYRTTPKAAIPLAEGQRLWGSRWGKLTGIRISGGAPGGFVDALRGSLDPLTLGLHVRSARAEALEASRGATDFGEYFSYFSFFLVVSALLLAGLLFRLGVEQRSSEIGTLRALGFSVATIRRLLLAEGLAVAIAGCIAGAALAIAWAAFIVYGLRTWWVDAVGTRDIVVSASPEALLLGGAGGLLIALLTVLLSLRRLAALTPRAAGFMPRGNSRRAIVASLICVVSGAALIAASAAGVFPKTGGFFGAGALLLISALSYFRYRLVRRVGTAKSVAELGRGYASYRPGRSVLAVALIGAATFLVVSVDSFRQTDEQTEGPYRLIAESVIPIYHDLNTTEGREALLIPPEISSARFLAFRLRPGDDASCLNLYAPHEPRIIGAPRAFQAPSALWQPQPDGAIPAAADINSMTYVLHKKIGDTMTVAGRKLRFVAALSGGVFQSELMISEENFRKAFPEEEGFRFFLIEGAPEIAGALETALADYGFDVTTTAARLAAYHRVENTYLATFQVLGGLGLLLGTVGLGIVLLRNVLERRRELALLRAVGFGQAQLQHLVLAENLLLLFTGVGTGTGAAILAIAPAWIARGGSVPILSISMLLAAVLVAGIAASVMATRAIGRMPLLNALRQE